MYNCSNIHSPHYSLVISLYVVHPLHMPCLAWATSADLSVNQTCSHKVQCTGNLLWHLHCVHVTTVLHSWWCKVSHLVLWCLLCCTSAVLNSKGLSIIFSAQCYLDGIMSYLLCFLVSDACYKVLLICALRFGEMLWWQRDGDAELGKVVSCVQTMHSGSSTQDEFPFSISRMEPNHALSNASTIVTIVWYSFQVQVQVWHYLQWRNPKI